MLQKLLLFFSILFLFSLSANAQREDAEFVRLGEKEGIYQSIIYALVQDNTGNIWAATEEGVLRFNSQKSYIYNNHRGLPADLRNRVTSITELKNGELIIGTEETVLQYDSDRDEFISILPEQENSPELVRSVVEGENGNVWIGGFNGLWSYSENGQLKQYLSKQKVLSLLSDEEVLLVGTNKGLIIFDPSSGQKIPQKLSDFNYTVRDVFAFGGGYLVGTEKNGLFSLSADFSNIKKVNIKGFSSEKFTVSKILPDEKGNIYLATDGAGLLYIDTNFNLLNAYTNDVNDPTSISGNGIYDLIIGKENILWVATYGNGLNKLKLDDNPFAKITHRINDPNSIAENFVRAVIEDSEGNMWFGRKEGLSVQLASSGDWKHFTLPVNGSPVPVLSFAEDDEYMWVGTYGRGAFKLKKSDFSYKQYSPNGDVRIPLAHVYALSKDKEGNIWLGGIREDLQKITTTGEVESFPLSQIRSIIPSSRGGIWVGGKKGVYHILDDEIETVKGVESGENGWTYTTVTALGEQKNGHPAVATNGGGLLLYNEEKQKYESFNLTNGLPSDVVQGLLFDRERNDMWLSTVRGLVQIKESSGAREIKVFDRNDGLASTEFNFGSFAKLSDGRLVFGGTEGVTIFHPKDIKAQREVPRIVLEDFKVLNDEKAEINLNSKKKIQLSYQQNALNISYAGILHSGADKVLYSWKMEGLNEVWTEPENGTSVNFTNLSPGDYVFKVRAANRDGVYSSPISLPFEVKAPWYATPLAYFIYFLLVAGLISGLIYVSNIMIKKKNADEQISFFNNITHELKTPLTILLSDLENSSEKGESANSDRKVKSTVKRLNTLFDQLLNFNKVTSGHYQAGEVKAIELSDYLKRLIGNFQPLLDKKNIEVKIENSWQEDYFYYDKTALDKICYNLISNAVKYSKQDGEITVEIHPKNQNELQLTVADKGIGIPEDQQKSILKRFYRGRNAINSQLPGTGLGLMIVKNLTERDKGSINFESIEGEGTTFTLLLHNKPEAFQAKPEEVIAVKKGQEKEKTVEFSDAKILIVEDNNELRKSLAERLGVHFQVFEAANGREGLEKAGELFPDLILTDMIMPEMDGMEMCRALKDNINMNHIPVFMMTVLNSTQNKIESVEEGIAAYMEKPLNFPFLLAKITATLARQRKLRERYLRQTEVKTAAKFRNERDAEFIDDLEKFVLEKVREESLSVHDLCRQVGMSRTALYMKLKNMVDLSPQNFIIHTRLKYARQLLTKGDSNVKEVAYEVGFSNPKYFSTSFKKLFGMSPTTFLKSLKD